jgi:hypothetical protein
MHDRAVARLFTAVRERAPLFQTSRLSVTLL